MSTRTPFGIKVVCGVGVLQSLLGGLVGLLMLAAGGLYAVFGLVALVFSGAQILGLVGLWGMESWGWWLTVVLYALSTVGSLLQVAGGNGFAILGLLLNAGILAYVASQREQFRSTRSATTPSYTH